MKAKSYNNYRSRLVTFLRWTGSPGANLLPSDYFQSQKLEKHKVPESLKPTISASDLKVLFDHITDRQDVACLALAKDAGVRNNGELARLKKKFICPDEMLIKLPGFDEDGTRITKTGKPREIELIPGLLARLQWLFDENLDPEFRISRVKDWSSKLHKIARSAGVILPHNAIRHGFGTHRLKVTGNPVLVYREMGNTYYNLMNHYAKHTNRAESDAWFAV